MNKLIRVIYLVFVCYLLTINPLFGLDMTRINKSKDARIVISYIEKNPYHWSGYVSDYLDNKNSDILSKQIFSYLYYEHYVKEDNKNRKAFLTEYTSYLLNRIATQGYRDSWGSWGAESILEGIVNVEGFKLNKLQKKYINILKNKDRKSGAEIIVLSLFLGIDEMPLQEYKPKWKHVHAGTSAAWFALIVQASSGDEVAVDLVLEKLDKTKKDRFIHRKISRQLRYIDNIKIIDYLVKYLFDDATTYPDQNIPGAKYARIYASYLSKIDPDFPFKEKKRFTSTDVDLLRKWYKKHKRYHDMKIICYPKRPKQIIFDGIINTTQYEPINCNSIKK